MDINEYLAQLPKLKRRADSAYLRYLELHERAVSPGCGLDLGDTGQRIKGSGNATEDRLIKAADGLREWRAANDKYKEIRAQLDAAVDELKYWQGCLIVHVYIYNVTFEADDDLKGADEILHTTNRREILAKLDESKRHLAEILRSQGVDIEN